MVTIPVDREPKQLTVIVRDKWAAYRAAGQLDSPKKDQYEMTALFNEWKSACDDYNENVALAVDDMLNGDATPKSASNERGVEVEDIVWKLRHFPNGEWIS